MLDWEGQTVVNSSNRYAGLHCILVLSSFARLDVLDQPVVVASVGVPDDVVQHDQLLELELEAVGSLAVQRFCLKLAEMEVSVFIVLHEALEGANLGRESQSVELPSDLREVFVDDLLGFGLLPVDPEIVKSLRGQLDHLRVGHDVEAELLVDETGPGLGHVPLVRYEAGPAEAAGTADPVHPLGPLGVQPAVRFLVFGFVDSDGLPLGVLHEVAPTGALVDPHRVHALVYGGLRLADQLGEGRIV